MKEFIRNFRKQEVVGTLSICSLSLGIMVAVVIGLWALNELNFDNFHKNGNRMYRVVYNFEMNNQPVRAATSFKPLGELAEAEIPEIEQMCRIVKEANNGITINEMVNFGLTALITDHNFFSFFSFPLKEGDIKTAFSAPDIVIITESTANRYFPDENPIGKKISFHGSDFSVSGVMYDMPHNSHIRADIVFPLFKHFRDWGWDSSFSYDTYFVISDNADIKAVKERLTLTIKKDLFSFFQGTRAQIELEHLKDIHFSKTYAAFDSAVKGDKKLLGIFIVIAVVILMIACINFINLFISTSLLRSKTIGVKKSHGSGRGRLMLDFYRETACYVFISVVAGVFLSMLTLPVFNSFVNSQVQIDFSSPGLYIFLLILMFVTVIMAGSFPAIYMTRFGIIETLTGKFRGKRMSAFQKALIIIQFASSVCLLIIVSFFGRQIDCILSQDLKFDNENVVYVNGWRQFGADYKSLRNEMVQCPNIDDVAMKQYDLPVRIGNGIGAVNVETGEKILLDLSEVSPNYFDFFGMAFVAGENPLTLESATALRYCVINERAVEALGLGEDPVGKTFILMSVGGGHEEKDGQSYMVKGVIQNSYVKSLHQQPDPQMYLGLSRDDHNPVFFKVAGDSREAIKAIEKKWKETVADVPFQYHFLDETYEALYTIEMNSRNVLGYALAITFMITAAGLFAMAFYSTQRRVKEIGLRKINGATVSDLLILLNKDIMIWVFIAFLVAVPVSYLFLRNWLEGFIVKVPLSGWVFVCAGLIAAVVALMTVSAMTWRAARANPVESLKRE